MVQPSSSLSPVLLLARITAPFCAGYFLSFLFRTVNAVIAPDLIAAAGLSAGDIGFLTSAYFLTFAAAQLPIGILLDHFGPRRVESGLLLLAALGALVFSLSHGLTQLVLARALIGLGVAACLMAPMKANVLWFSKEKLPLMNGLVLAAGGLGALTATRPVELALSVTDWRGVFVGLAALTCLVALLIFFIVPEKPAPTSALSLRSQWQGVVRIFSDRNFWRIAPISTAAQATFLAIQGLWAGAWLRDAAGLSRTDAADFLLALSFGMFAGYLLIGALAVRLQERWNIRPFAIAAIGQILFVLAQIGLLCGWVDGLWLLMLMFGFFGTSNMLNYSMLAQSFPPELAGRVTTALNLMVFCAAFAAQSGIGWIVGHWTASVNGAYPPEAYQAAFGVMLALQAITFVWALIPPRAKA